MEYWIGTGDKADSMMIDVTMFTLSMNITFLDGHAELVEDTESLYGDNFLSPAVSTYPLEPRGW